jgi:hypothetical protein
VDEKSSLLSALEQRVAARVEKRYVVVVVVVVFNSVLTIISMCLVAIDNSTMRFVNATPHNVNLAHCGICCCF